MAERGPLDALDALAEIGGWAPPAGYDGTAQYRDFRAVLLDGEASPEQCRRVLNIVLAQCGVLKSPLKTRPVGGDEQFAEGLAIDTSLTLVRIGEQNIGRWLLAQIMERPRSEPLAEQAVSEEPKE